ncbi:failed axon connections homolog isoform X2 [Ostrea edulis]|uniref:failed axon connections homolog isoform X2 n=1 Tax=Ostrea edulis TaxID=37623 RepID=UPI0024AF24CB|nr:failed axon connections homolog isoform X2 [Ostrea edulis]
MHNMDAVFSPTGFLRVCGTVALGTLIILVLLKLRRKPRKSYPNDIVVHHQPGRAPFAPSMTPFAVKLETFLRMTKVPSMNVFDSRRNRSSKGKMTWIEYNGEEIADSEICIEFIKNKFNVDLNKEFTPEEIASGFMIQKMVEEHLYWTMALNRWVYERGLRIHSITPLPFYMRFLICRHISKQAQAQGVGRHSEEEVQNFMIHDLENLSVYMGSKKFLLGDKPSQADCAVFGMLSQFYWQGFGGKTEEAIKNVELGRI